MAVRAGKKHPAAAAGTRARPGARELLLQAAIAEFATKGFAGARVDEIAASSGVNKQLVYHYFGSKEDLYVQALEAVYAEIRAKEQALHLEELEPVEAMSRLIGFSFDYLATHPEFIALLIDENLSRGIHIRQSESLREMHSPFIALLNTTLRRGVTSGAFRGDFDAVNLYISIAALSFFFFSNNHTLSTIFDKALDSATARERRRAHVIAFALNALRPDRSAHTAVTRPKRRR